MDLMSMTFFSQNKMINIKVVTTSTNMDPGLYLVV